MQNEYEIKKEMCEIGKRVYNRGMVAANDGNFSVNSMTMSFSVHYRCQQRIHDTGIHLQGR